MPLRFGLVPRAQPHEGLALHFQRVVERHVDRGAQHLDRGHRRIEAASAFGMRGDDLVECVRIAAQRGKLVLAVARAGERPLLGENFSRESYAGRCRIALENLVDQSCRQRILRRDRIAGQNHRRGFFHADEPRKPLRAAGAGNEPELDFRQSEPRARLGDAEMTGERNLKPAAKRRAEHRGDDRLADRVDQRDHVRQSRRHRRLVEFGDIGAGDEGAPIRRQHNRFDLGVVTRATERIDQRRPHVMAQRIDRRIDRP